MILSRCYYLVSKVLVELKLKYPGMNSSMIHFGRILCGDWIIVLPRGGFTSSGLVEVKRWLWYGMKLFRWLTLVCFNVKSSKKAIFEKVEVVLFDQIWRCRRLVHFSSRLKTQRKIFLSKCKAVLNAEQKSFGGFTKHILFMC